MTLATLATLVAWAPFTVFSLLWLATRLRDAGYRQGYRDGYGIGVDHGFAVGMEATKESVRRQAAAFGIIVRFVSGDEADGEMGRGGFVN